MKYIKTHICLLLIIIQGFEVKGQSGPFTILDSSTVFNPANGGAVLLDPIFTGSEFWFRSNNIGTGRDSVFIFDKNLSTKETFLLPNNKVVRALTWNGVNIIISSELTAQIPIIYIIDTFQNAIISSKLTNLKIEEIAFDPTADNGKGGYWVRPQFNLSSTGIYLLDTGFNIIDSIPKTQIPTNPGSLYSFTVDTSSFNETHLIFGFRGPPLNNVLNWFNTSTKIFTNSRYYSFQDNGICDYINGVFISNSYDTLNPNGNLFTLTFDPNDSTNKLINYELGPPPAFPAPVNDDICGALEIKLDSPSIFFNNLEATASPNEPVATCFTHPVDSSIWFKVVVTNPSFYVQKGPNSPITPCNPAINDYQIAAYDLIGNGCQALPIQIGCGDENGGPWGTFARTTVRGHTLGDTVYIQHDGDWFPNYAYLQAVSIPTISRDFELYDTTRYIALYDDEWFLDSGLTNGQIGEDSRVSDEQSQSGDYSLKIQGSEKPVYHLYDLDSIVQLVGFSMYIPSGNQSYFELKNTDSSNLFNVQFGLNNNGLLSHDSTSFIFPNDQWFNLEFYFDLDNDSMLILIDQSFVLIDAIPGNPKINSFQFEPSRIDSINNIAYIDDMLNTPFLFPNIPGSQLSAFDLLQPNDKSKLIIDNGMLYNNLFKWESSTDQLGLETKYEFKLLEDSAGSFVEKYNRELSLDSTFLSEFQIDSIFTSIGLNQNDTFNGFWEVKAKTSLDSRSSLNGPFEISIYRGTYVGLEIKDQNHRINLFPNPNKGELYVESSLSEFELKIYDLNGRLQFQDRIKSANKKLDINSLKSGLYLIRIDSDTKSWTRKLFLDK